MKIPLGVIPCWRRVAPVKVVNSSRESVAAMSFCVTGMNDRVGRRMIDTYSFPHIVLRLGIPEFILRRAIEDAYRLYLMGSVHKVTF
jgi:hypothetical protein